MNQDIGNRREFDTGAVLDIAEGKGRCDLLPLDVVSNISDPSLEIDVVLANIDSFLRYGKPQYLYKVISDFSMNHYADIYSAMLDVSKHYEEGCKKYGDRNWEKGIPLHCYIDSGVRHYLKFQRGDNDERHDRAFLWNMLGLLWTMKHKPEMNDLPFKEEQK